MAAPGGTPEKDGGVQSPPGEENAATPKTGVALSPGGNEKPPKCALKGLRPPRPPRGVSGPPPASRPLIRPPQRRRVGVPGGAASAGWAWFGPGRAEPRPARHEEISGDGRRGRSPRAGAGGAGGRAGAAAGRGSVPSAPPSPPRPHPAPRRREERAGDENPPRGRGRGGSGSFGRRRGGSFGRPQIHGAGQGGAAARGGDAAVVEGAEGAAGAFLGGLAGNAGRRRRHRGPGPPLPAPARQGLVGARAALQGAPQSLRRGPQRCGEAFGVPEGEAAGGGAGAGPRVPPKSPRGQNPPPGAAGPGPGHQPGLRRPRGHCQGQRTEGDPGPDPQPLGGSRLGGRGRRPRGAAAGPGGAEALAEGGHRRDLPGRDRGAAGLGGRRLEEPDGAPAQPQRRGQGAGGGHAAAGALEAPAAPRGPPAAGGAVPAAPGAPPAPRREPPERPARAAGLPRRRLVLVLLAEAGLERGLPVGVLGEPQAAAAAAAAGLGPARDPRAELRRRAGPAAAPQKPGAAADAVGNHRGDQNGRERLQGAGRAGAVQRAVPAAGPGAVAAAGRGAGGTGRARGAGAAAALGPEPSLPAAAQPARRRAQAFVGPRAARGGAPAARRGDAEVQHRARRGRAAGAPAARGQRGALPGDAAGFPFRAAMSGRALNSCFGVFILFHPKTPFIFWGFLVFFSLSPRVLGVSLRIFPTLKSFFFGGVLLLSPHFF